MKTRLPLFVFVIICYAVPAFAQRQISVLGEGTSVAKPDYAVLSLSIQSRSIPGISAGSASDENILHLKSILGNAGIASTDIEETDFREFNDYYNRDYRGRTNYALKPSPAPMPPIADTMQTVTSIKAKKQSNTLKKKDKKSPKKEDVVVESDLSTPEPVPPPIPAPEPLPMADQENRQVKYTFRVKVHNISSLPSVMEAARQAGSEDVFIERFDYAARGDLKNEAEANAMKNAREKAARMAKEMGGTLGDIISIDDSPNGSGFDSLAKLIAEETRGKYGNMNMSEVSEKASVKVIFSIR